MGIVKEYVEKFVGLKKRVLWIAFLTGISFLWNPDKGLAQQLPTYPDSLFSTYYHQKRTQYELLPHREGEIIFLGNSITDGGAWYELFDDPQILNRGISGDVTKGILNRLGEVIERKPKKVFLLIGTNDLARGETVETVLENIRKIVSLIHDFSPSTEVYVQSIFPVNPAKGLFGGHTKREPEINSVNEALKKQASENKYTYIDVFKALQNDEGQMDLAYSNDGLHLLGAGYMTWKHVVFPYVYDLNEKPSILPKPRNLTWTQGKFPLYQRPVIVVKDESLASEAKILKEELAAKGLPTSIEDSPGDRPYIELVLGKVEATEQADEAYQLSVTDKSVKIVGNTATGVFYGIQSLRQLMRDGVFIDGVEITDWPAFGHRGYMIDVGRNYQSMKQIKEQIDELGHYKMNVFHFHPTEDFAWRLQIKQYPQLTDQEFMTRNKGEYYTIGQVKELMAYCQGRHIEFILEIDMPGHSEAFRKAMGVDMQSEEGVEIVKNILKEVNSTYEGIKRIHIGADEVKITNEEFVPQMVDLIESMGKEVIGWSPGGNYDDRVIQQLWMSTGAEGKNIKYIDSRDMYTNHMDPINGVLTIFNRRIGDVEKGNANILGGELAIWNDNRVKREEDNLEMNLAYPGMLAYAERSWQGGGYLGFLTDMGEKGSDRYLAFQDFEKRLLDQKKLFFKHKPFPYQAQGQIDWKLFGPFDNKGNLTAEFWPEKELDRAAKSKPDMEVSGGTIWMRHFFAPLVKGTLEEPKENSTWYAYREIYSPEDKEAGFWIGFDNPSRSYVVETPERGKWDNRESRVWVNGTEVAPPQWTYPGRDGSREDPMIDEGYEYREPTKVALKKGWNKVLIKAPVGSFAKRTWQHPVKWMFTFVEVDE